MARNGVPTKWWGAWDYCPDSGRSPMARKMTRSCCPSKWQSWGSSSSWSMDKIWSSRSVALCQFRMFLGKGTTMTVSLIENFHWNKMLCKLPCYLCCLSPSDLVPTRGGWPQHQESSRNEACYLGHGNRETHEKVFKKQIPDQTKMICLII